MNQTLDVIEESLDYSNKDVSLKIIFVGGTLSWSKGKIVAILNKDKKIKVVFNYKNTKIVFTLPKNKCYNNPNYIGCTLRVYQRFNKYQVRLLNDSKEFESFVEFKQYIKNRNEKVVN